MLCSGVDKSAPILVLNHTNRIMKSDSLAFTIESQLGSSGLGRGAQKQVPGCYAPPPDQVRGREYVPGCYAPPPDQ
eukprot:1194400-Prorocentrum_minimum.AAC.1